MDKFATLGSLYELKCSRRSRPGVGLPGATSTPNLQGPGNKDTSKSRAHSISACVSEATRCALAVCTEDNQRRGSEFAAGNYYGKKNYFGTKGGEHIYTGAEKNGKGGLLMEGRWGFLDTDVKLKSNPRTLIPIYEDTNVEMWHEASSISGNCTKRNEQEHCKKLEPLKPEVSNRLTGNTDNCITNIRLKEHVKDFKISKFTWKVKHAKAGFNLSESNNMSERKDLREKWSDCLQQELTNKDKDSQGCDCKETFNNLKCSVATRTLEFPATAPLAIQIDPEPPDALAALLRGTFNTKYLPNKVISPVFTRETRLLNTLKRIRPTPLHASGISRCLWYDICPVRRKSRTNGCHLSLLPSSVLYCSRIYLRSFSHILDRLQTDCCRDSVSNNRFNN